MRSRWRPRSRLRLARRASTPRRRCATSELALARAPRRALPRSGAVRVRAARYRSAVRLIVARCEVSYIGRATTVLPEAVRLLMCKGDGTFMVWADGGSPNVKPLNWMTPPTVLTEERDQDGALERLVVRKRRDDERLEIAVSEVMAD